MVAAHYPVRLCRVQQAMEPAGPRAGGAIPDANSS
jgi:hypothetical protein